MEIGEATVAVRKIIHKCLKVFGDGVTQVEKHMETELSRLVSKICDCQGKDIDIAVFLRESLANSMTSLLTGKPAEEGDSEIIWNVIKTRNMLSDRKINTILTTFPVLRHMPGKCGRLFREAIQARNKCFERFAAVDADSNGHDGDNIITMLYALQKEVNIRAGHDLIDHCYIFIAIVYDIIYVGIATSLRALINAFAIRIRYDGCAMKIQEEIDRVNGSEAPSLSDRSKMPYTRAFILEVLRYTSQGRLSMPHRASEDILFEGYLIKKDSEVVMNTWFIHHDPRIWGDPYCFRPERFLDPHGQLVPPDHELRQSVVLFSFGKRACPGETLALARMFLYITRLLQVFDLHPLSSGLLPNTDPQSLKTENYMCQATARL